VIHIKLLLCHAARNQTVESFVIIYPCHAWGFLPAITFL